MTRPFLLLALFGPGPLFAALVWRATLAFSRGQVVRGCVWASGAMVELLVIGVLLDRLALRW